MTAITMWGRGGVLDGTAVAVRVGWLMQVDAWVEELVLALLASELEVCCLHAAVVVEILGRFGLGVP